MGAGIAIWYSSIFPEDVDRMISMDLVNVEPLTLEKHVKKTGESIKQGVEVFKKLSKSDTVPTYTYEDAVARAYMANQFHLGIHVHILLLVFLMKILLTFSDILKMYFL